MHVLYISLYNFVYTNNFRCARFTPVMAHVLSNGLDVMGSGRSPRLDPEFQKNLNTMTNMAETNTTISDWERRHVKAVALCADGYVQGFSPKICLPQKKLSQLPPSIFY